MADAGLPDEVVCVCQAGFTISTYEVNEEFFETSGTFQPLSYWERQGYDVNLIKANSSDKDKIKDAVLGECYRVRLLTTGERGKRGQKEESNTAGHAKGKKFKPISLPAAKPDESE